MSKRIIISETEKQRIKSLYINEDNNTLEGRIFEIFVDGGTRIYKITDIQSDKNFEGKYILYTNQERTNERSGGKWFGGKKQFYFDCTLPDLYGYDGRIINSEKYSSSSNDDLKYLIQSLQKELCG
jgi:hypothetical protein